MKTISEIEKDTSEVVGCFDKPYKAVLFLCLIILIIFLIGIFGFWILSKFAEWINCVTT